MKTVKINLPLTGEIIKTLKAGDKVLLSGTLYTARDAAHQKICAALQKGKTAPIELKDKVIYYAGPAPAPPGYPIGSCGPTTSSRMDSFTPFLLEQGLKGMIGKGNRSEEVREAIKKHGAVYFVAVGGAGALLAKRIKKAEVIAYEDLGPEAIYKLEVEDFPVLVAIDAKGCNVFSEESK